MPSLQTEDSGKAFALVIAAGAATGIGSAAVFFPQLVKLANRRTLSAALAFAAGVMLYVSLVDIYGKAVDGFVDGGHDDDKSFIYATLTFFAGLILMKVLDVCIKMALGKGQYSPEDNIDAFIQAQEENQTQKDAAVNQATSSDYSDNDKEDEEQQNVVVDGNPEKQLFQMGASTAVAIAMHNFPEGLVTFAGYVADPAVGIALAVGIAIHNIPEGLCVSMPIYYSTGNRLKAFLWGILSGVSEPLGALVGWVILNNSFSGTTNGILFGLVGGIMTFIAIDELLPMAVKYDTEGKIVSPCVFLGMFLIAASLMLFSI